MIPTHLPNSEEMNFDTRPPDPAPAFSLCPLTCSEMYVGIVATMFVSAATGSPNISTYGIVPVQTLSRMLVSFKSFASSLTPESRIFALALSTLTLRIRVAAISLSSGGTLLPSHRPATIPSVMICIAHRISSRLRGSFLVPGSNNVAVPCTTALR